MTVLVLMMKAPGTVGSPGLKGKGEKKSKSFVENLLSKSWQVIAVRKKNMIYNEKKDGKKVVRYEKEQRLIYGTCWGILRLAQ